MKLPNINLNKEDVVKVAAVVCSVLGTIGGVLANHVEKHERSEEIRKAVDEALAEKENN